VERREYGRVGVCTSTDCSRVFYADKGSLTEMEFLFDEIILRGTMIDDDDEDGDY
jgi:hypothetical protein